MSLCSWYFEGILHAIPEAENKSQTRIESSILRYLKVTASLMNKVVWRPLITSCCEKLIDSLKELLMLCHV